MTDKIDEKALAGLPEYLKQILGEANCAPWNRDPKVREHIANLERWLNALAAKQTSPSTSSAPSAEVTTDQELHLGLCLDDDMTLHATVMTKDAEPGGAATVLLSDWRQIEKGCDYIMSARLGRPLAAPPSSAAKPEEPGPSGDVPSDFQEGQWWLAELDALATMGTDNSKRAVAVVRNLMRTAHAQAAKPECAAGDGGEAVASIYITLDGQREMDDWRVDLPTGRNILYTRPTPSAASAVDWCDANDTATANALRTLLRREPSLKEVTEVQKAVCSAASARVPLRDPRMEPFDQRGPLPGMIAAFENHFGQSWTDKDWRDEASTWAAAWKAAIETEIGGQQ